MRYGRGGFGSGGTGRGREEYFPPEFFQVYKKCRNFVPVVEGSVMPNKSWASLI